ncbi:PREDICTED: noelin-like, partial [Priapulus caudatus]|uniref:Noelin-like n=1 Tax=Priapulus caudatus TaxID=37621 RepID=A0ABM1F6Q3_PRICU
SCNEETLGGILQPITHAWESAAAQKYGAWMMDPLPPTGDETKIYVLGGYTNARALWMYGNYADFVTRRRKTVITLPTGVGGTGHVIYNGTIYYPQYNTAKVNTRCTVQLAVNTGSVTPARSHNTWKTNAKKAKVGNTFFICGVMYSVEAHTILDNRVSYKYDTNTQEGDLISIPFSIKYGLLNQMLYNARHRAIFAWDNGHLISYPVEFQPSR